MLRVNCKTVKILKTCFKCITASNIFWRIEIILQYRYVTHIGSCHKKKLTPPPFKSLVWRRMPSTSLNLEMQNETSNINALTWSVRSLAEPMLKSTGIWAAISEMRIKSKVWPDPIDSHLAQNESKWSRIKFWGDTTDWQSTHTHNLRCRVLLCSQRSAWDSKRYKSNTNQIASRA